MIDSKRKSGKRKCSDHRRRPQATDIRFCQVLSKGKGSKVVRTIDPDELIKRCRAPTFKGYLHWRCKSGIKKESTVITWKVLSMLYCDKTASWMESKVLADIGNVSLRYAFRVLDNMSSRL